jgi:hypothetical protein
MTGQSVSRRPLPIIRCAQLEGRKPTLEDHDDLDHGEWIGPEAEKAETSGMTAGNADMVGVERAGIRPKSAIVGRTRMH